MGRDINSRDASCAATSPRSNNSASEIGHRCGWLGAARAEYRANHRQLRRGRAKPKIPTKEPRLVKSGITDRERSTQISVRANQFGA
ncbi:MAG: hypothetical protein QOF92_947 [Pseudonocardiales bacterium]|nr:hypothetical protein [Pseudonocardiales bacterium]